MDDPTFRAFRKDRNFLQTILPISDGLNTILHRIFEVDPTRRISLQELQQMVLSCPQLGQDSNDGSLPPSPAYSPLEKPADSVVFYPTVGNGLEPVPNVDPLPVQQYPTFSGAHFNNPHTTYAPAPLPSPPGSTHGSPRQSPYTYQPKPVTPASCGPFASGASHISSFSSWSRCSNFVPNLANQVCWKNVLVS